ncbi:MAG: ABC transporter permease [Patescibacteria group bacterium]
MKKYWLVFKISIQDFLEYRFDFFLHTFKYAVALLFTAAVWLAVAAETGQELVNKEYIVTYYSLAAIIFSLSSFHTFYIEEDIKNGQLSKYLVKPISAFRYYFSHESAAATMETSIKTLVVLPIIFLVAGASVFEINRLIVTVLFLPIIFLFCVNLYTLISQLAFWVQEIHALRWAVLALVRLQAGFFVPVTFFPESYKSVAFFFPFQHLAHTPIEIFMGKIDPTTGLNALMILLLWTVVVVYGRKAVWKLGTCSYESTGI